MSEEAPKPPFDEKLVRLYLGKYVLIGISHFDSNGKLKHQEQIHGIVSEISGRGIAVTLKGTHEGQIRRFPPDIRSLSFARPGEYTLRATNEVIRDPDLLWTWNVVEKPEP